MLLGLCVRVCECVGEHACACLDGCVHVVVRLGVCVCVHVRERNKITRHVFFCDKLLQLMYERMFSANDADRY